MTGSVLRVPERRKHDRIKTDGATFVVLRPDYNRLGQVIDVGLGGLAFRYMTDLDSWSASKIMDIFVVGHEFYLDDIPFETVWDFPAPQVVPWGPATMRRRGVRFGDLTLPQSVRLAQLMGGESRYDALTQQNP